MITTHRSMRAQYLHRRIFSPPDCGLASEVSLEVKLDEMMERLTRMEADMVAVTDARDKGDQGPTD